MKPAVFALSLGGVAALLVSCASASPSVNETSAEQQAQIVPCTDGAGTNSGGASAGSAGANAISGAGGMSGGGQAPSYGGAATFMPGPLYTAPAHQNNLIHIKNGCAFPLWLHGDGGGGVLMPDNQKVEAGATFDYTRGD
jgi:hypothetical protein